MKAKSHIIQVPVYLYVDVTEEELKHPDVDFIIEAKVLEKYKNSDWNNDWDNDWDIYETEYEES
jgi:hypothetical protein